MVCLNHAATMHLGHVQIGELIAFVERHGYALLFAWVAVEQSAIPLPSVPLLLASGALIRAGRMHALPAVLCCVLAALIADTIWFVLGRVRGRQVLRLLCRLSLEPDTCVRQTENAFVKYGMNSLLVSKFIPGLNTVAAPLAGHSRRSYLGFTLYDGAGAALWSGAYLAIGYLFSEQLETAMEYASRFGSNVLLVIAGSFGIWIGWKYIQRRRFLRQLYVARITPAELRQRLNDGEEIFIVDLRGAIETEEASIPGAVRIAPSELAQQSAAIPRDRDIVLFCS